MLRKASQLPHCKRPVLARGHSCTAPGLLDSHSLPHPGASAFQQPCPKGQRRPAARQRPTGSPTCESHSGIPQQHQQHGGGTDASSSPARHAAAGQEPWPQPGTSRHRCLHRQDRGAARPREASPSRPPRLLPPGSAAELSLSAAPGQPSPCLVRHGCCRMPPPAPEAEPRACGQGCVCCQRPRPPPRAVAAA